MKHRFAALLGAVMLTCGFAPAFSGLHVSGASGRLTIADSDALYLVYALKNWLSGKGNYLSSEITDMNGDGRFDARDLTLYKRQIMPEREEKELIEAPVRALNPSLPSTGNLRIPVFAVSFPDCAFDEKDIAAQAAQAFFGLQDPLSYAYPYESVAAYYGRSSYGRLCIEGDVFTYTAEKPIASYIQHNGRELVQEVLAAYEAQLDYSDYDTDCDGRIDDVVIIVPEAAKQVDEDADGVPDWWPFSVSDNCTEQFDGLEVGAYCAGMWAEKAEVPDFCRKMAHELCHGMGMPDYYLYNLNNAFTTDGMEGGAGYELMDEGNGDLSAFSKLMLGWLAEDEIYIYTGGEQIFSITSMQQKPACVMIPRNPEAGFLSEFFLIEFLTGEANNSNYFYKGQRAMLLQAHGGARLLHCQAEVTDGKFGPEFKYNNNSPFYDDSNLRQRILRLLNSYDLISSGNNLQKIFDGSTPAFHWYGETGEPTEETGLWVRISGPQAGPDYVFEEIDPLSSKQPYNIDDPDFLDMATFTVEIKPIT